MAEETPLAVEAASAEDSATGASGESKARNPEYEVVLTSPPMTEPSTQLCTTRAHVCDVHVLRLLPGTDLLSELQQFAKKEGLRAAFVQTCVGSTAATRLRPAGKSSPIQYAGKFEIVSLTGTLSAESHHLHMSIADANGAVFGGHVMEGCVVRTTAEIVVGVVDGLTFERHMDERSGFDELYLSETSNAMDNRNATVTRNSSGSFNIQIMHCGGSELGGSTNRRNIGFWAYITGEDAVGLPPDAQKINLWAYIAGDDRVGCSPQSRGYGWLGLF